MGRMQRLPFLLSGVVTVLTGIISYAGGSENKATYTRMAVVMVIFYIIGQFIQKTFMAISSDIEKRKMEEEEKKQEENIQEEKHQGELDKSVPHKIDLRADDSADGFVPLDLGKAISSKLKE